uniref:ARID domain-containing protein n=1 Tax=Steinernema glaseri TaxID=37863 RepID=A0A1I7ZWK2_9BILA
MISSMSVDSIPSPSAAPESVANDPVSGFKDENQRSPSPKNNVFENAIEAQQKALHKFTSSLSNLNFRSPFPMNVLPPFLTAALQQNPLLQQQMLGLSTTAVQMPPTSFPVFGTAPSAASNASPTTNDDDDDSENVATTEPEDLTVSNDFRFRKEKKADSSEDGDQNLQQSWSFEEQFKQLYELSGDLKRKEWLDDWLSFMHKIGKPVTRIPIMAKQVLDLYELYRLVVQHGGLVEIINKKLWREITKGLNLPSSITSAAFTLRTQYQKYLYDYECEKESLSNPTDLQQESLSNPTDLQQAIDGNRREGRRTGGSASSSSAAFPYSLAQHGTHALLAAKHHLNFGLGSNDEENSGLGSQQALVAAYKAEQMANIEAQQRHFEMVQRAAAEAASRQALPNSGRESTSSYDSDPPAAKRTRTDSRTNEELSQANPATPSLERIFSAVPTTHLKISNGRAVNGEQTMVVSMEINGTMYQGVLFALKADGSDAPRIPTL